MSASADFNLQDLSCPKCGTPGLRVADDGKRLVCSRCQAGFVVAGAVCPVCGLVNEPAGATCARCGSPISRPCPACGTSNWALAETCERCGRNLDPIADMAARWAHGTQDRLAEQMSSARELKRREATASDARSAALWEIERRRQEQLQRDLARRRQQERRIIAIAIVAIGFMVMLVLVIALLQAAR